MGYIFDIILVAIILFMVIFFAKKGFILSSKSILSLLLTVILMVSLQDVVLDGLQKTPFGISIQNGIRENIEKTYKDEKLPEDADTSDSEQAKKICESMSLPVFLSDGIEKKLAEMTDMKNNVMDVITDTITQTLLKVIAFLILYVLVHLLVFFGIKFLDKLFCLPILKTINRFLGAAAGAVNALLVIYIICGGIGLFVPTDNLAEVNRAIEQTYIVKYFYNNNLLFSLFM